MIYEIVCWILEFFFFFFNVYFSKQPYFGIFDLGLKTPQTYKNCSKNGQNHQIALLSFTIHKKKSNF